MLTHEQIWRGVDRLALRNGLSPSGLAKRAGLDPTTFNKSKRITPDGKQRWPGTESLSKILEATQTSMADFVTLIDDTGGTQQRPADLKLKSIRLSKITEASFDKTGFVNDGDWEDAEFPAIDDPKAYIVELDRELEHGLFRSGSLLVISPSSSVRRQDRVMVRLKDGSLHFGTVKRKTAQQLVVAENDEESGEHALSSREIDWVVRVLWISQ